MSGCGPLLYPGRAPGGRLLRWATTMIVAFDPGKNLGVAFVGQDGTLERGLVLEPSALAAFELPADATLLVGDGTGSAAVVSALTARGLSVQLVGERGTSLEGRELYFAAHPPRGLARLLPRGLLNPPVLIDDYAAYAIALRWLEDEEARRG